MKRVVAPILVFIIIMTTLASGCTGGNVQKVKNSGSKYIEFAFYKETSNPETGTVLFGEKTYGPGKIYITINGTLRIPLTIKNTTDINVTKFPVRYVMKMKYVNGSVGVIYNSTAYIYVISFPVYGLVDKSNGEILAFFIAKRPKHPVNKTFASKVVIANKSPIGMEYIIIPPYTGDETGYRIYSVFVVNTEYVKELMKKYDADLIDGLSLGTISFRRNGIRLEDGKKVVGFYFVLETKGNFNKLIKTYEKIFSIYGHVVDPRDYTVNDDEWLKLIHILGELHDKINPANILLEGFFPKEEMKAINVGDDVIIYPDSSYSISIR